MGRLATVHSVREDESLAATVLALAEFARVTYGGPVLVVDAAAPWPGGLAARLGCTAPRTLEELARLGGTVSDPMLNSLFVVPGLEGLEFVQLANSPTHFQALKPDGLTQWLARLRGRYSYTLVSAGTHLTPWTLAAFGAADLTVELAPPAGPDYARTVEMLTLLRGQEFSADRVVVVGVGANGVALQGGDPARWVGYDVSACGPLDPAVGPTQQLVRDLFDRWVRVEPLVPRSQAAGAWAGRPGDIQTMPAGSQIAESSKQAGPERELDVLRRRLHEELVAALNLKARGNWWQDPEEKARLRDEAQRIVSITMDRLGGGELDRDTRQRLVTAVLNEAFGLGPLEELVARSDISEIMVNGPDTIFVERDGKLERSLDRFTDLAQLMNVIDRIVAPLGRRVDEASPYVDARLPDGSRVNIVIPPLALDGPAITIRKFRTEPLRAADLLQQDALSPQMADFLELCVLQRKNIMISGGTGTGKTTLLNVLSDYVPDTERIVTIEDSAELRLLQPHVCRLEARPANIQGTGQVSIRDLVRNALRMRPDRIVVGECRGGEALDMLQAMNTGHDGALSTVHANSPADALRRLETLCLFAGLDLPARAVRTQIGAALDFVVQLTRFADGRRRVTEIAEVLPPTEDGALDTTSIFTFDPARAAGASAAPFQPTGAVPAFVERLMAAGTYVPRELFQPAGF